MEVAPLLTAQWVQHAVDSRWTGWTGWGRRSRDCAPNKDLSQLCLPVLWPGADSRSPNLRASGSALSRTPAFSLLHATCIPP